MKPQVTLPDWRYRNWICAVSVLGMFGAEGYKELAYRAHRPIESELRSTWECGLRQVAVLMLPGVTFGLVIHSNEYTRYPLWKVRRAYFWAKRGYVRPRPIHEEF